MATSMMDRPANLDPEILRRVLAMEQGRPTVDAPNSTTWAGSNDLNPYALVIDRGVTYGGNAGDGNDSLYRTGNQTRGISMDTGDGFSNSYNEQGVFDGRSKNTTQTDDLKRIATFVAMAFGAYYAATGVAALEGAGAAATTGGTTAATTGGAAAGGSGSWLSGVGAEAAASGNAIANAGTVASGVGGVGTGAGGVAMGTSTAGMLGGGAAAGGTAGGAAGGAGGAGGAIGGAGGGGGGGMFSTAWDALQKAGPVGSALIQAGGQVVSGIGQAVSQRAAEKRADAKTEAELARYNHNIGTRLWPRTGG